MDPIKSIGKKLIGGEQRDAIHIAIMPVVVGEKYISAGEEVGLVYGTKNTVKRKDSIYGIETIGVIDPFLKDWDIKEGDVVWCFLKPGTITGLRHEWIHPGIDNQQPPKNEAEKWLREFADKWNFDYDEMIGIASAGTVKKTMSLGSLGSHTFDSEYIVARGIDLHSRDELGADYELFWQHMEALTGQKFDAQHREKVGWSCTC